MSINLHEKEQINHVQHKFGHEDHDINCPSQIISPDWDTSDVFPAVDGANLNYSHHHNGHHWNFTDRLSSEEQLDENVDNWHFFDVLLIQNEISLSDKLWSLDSLLVVSDSKDLQPLVEALLRLFLAQVIKRLQALFQLVSTLHLNELFVSKSLTKGLLFSWIANHEFPGVKQLDCLLSVHLDLFKMQKHLLFDYVHRVTHFLQSD